MALQSLPYKKIHSTCIERKELFKAGNSFTESYHSWNHPCAVVYECRILKTCHMHALHLQKYFMLISMCFGLFWEFSPKLRSIPKMKRAARHPPVFVKSCSTLPWISTGENPILYLSSTRTLDPLGVNSCAGCNMKVFGAALSLPLDTNMIGVVTGFFPSFLEGEIGIVAEGEGTGIHCSATGTSSFR